MTHKILLFIFFFLSSLSCKKEEITTPTPEENPGKQKDIHWPILANAPWPMLQHDPQHTGRSKTKGPRIGAISWEYKPPYGIIECSVVIGRDSTLYVPYSRPAGLYALRYDGSVKYNAGQGEWGGIVTPIILYDNSILNFDGDNIYRIDSNGSVIWKSDVVISSESDINIGSDGTIYFITDNTLYAFDLNGKKLWTVTDSKFYYGAYIVISPDSKTMYLRGDDKTGVIAFDLTTKQIKWTFGKNISEVYAVDSYGNVLVSSFVDSINQGKGTLFSLTENGEVRWYKGHRNYSISVLNKITSRLPPPTIDGDGNTIYVSDSLYSIDFLGNVRWAKKFELKQWACFGALVCDNEGFIYVSQDVFPEFELYAFTSAGDQIFKVSSMKGYSGRAPAVGYENLVIPNDKDQWLYTIK